MTEMPKPQIANISARLAPVIEAAMERIHYAETRRENYSVMAGALIAAGITFFAFAFGTEESQWIHYGAVGGSLAMIFVGVLVVYVFGRQTNRYPFTNATDTWKWYYRDALPDHTAFNLKPWHSWGAKNSHIQKVFAEQLPIFKARMLSLADDETDLDQDIQEIYVLHINEKYKNIYLEQLRTIFNLGLIFIAVVTIASGLAGAWYEAVTNVPASITFSDSATT